MYPYIETGDFPKKVLKLQRLEGIKEVKKLPQYILDKHVALLPLTENRATEGSCLMRLLGPGKSRISQKSR